MRYYFFGNYLILRLFCVSWCCAWKNVMSLFKPKSNNLFVNKNNFRIEINNFHAKNSTEIEKNSPQLTVKGNLSSHWLLSQNPN